MKSLVFTAFVLSTYTTFAYDFSPRSPTQVAKQAQRWSLSQWMEQKSQFRWMDAWLAGNKKTMPSFYEFYLGADYSSYTTSTTSNGVSSASTSYNSTRMHAGGFISILGVIADYDRSTNENRKEWEAMGVLRLLGHTDQGFNLNIFYGLRDLSTPMEQVQNQQYGGYITLYLTNSLGLQGRYNYYAPKTSTLQNQIDGHRIEGTAFVEYGAARIYGSYFKETNNSSTPSTSAIATNRQGFNVGLRLYLDLKGDK